MPESGEVVQLVDDGGASSFERRVLSNSVDANATKRSKPELTRSCQLDSSSPTSSVVVRHSTVQALVRVWLMGVQSEVAVVVVVGGGDGYGSHLAAIVIWRGTNWDGTCLRIQFRRRSHVAGGDAVVADSQLGSLVSGCDTVGAGCSYDRRRSKSSLNSQL